MDLAQLWALWCKNASGITYAASALVALTVVGRRRTTAWRRRREAAQVQEREKQADMVIAKLNGLYMPKPDVEAGFAKLREDVQVLTAETRTKNQELTAETRHSNQELMAQGERLNQHGQRLDQQEAVVAQHEKLLKEQTGLVEQVMSDWLPLHQRVTALEHHQPVPRVTTKAAGA